MTTTCRCICHVTGDPTPVGECCQYVHDSEQWKASPGTCICHSGSVCGPACANRHHGGCPYDRPSLQRLLSGADLPEDERDAYRIARAGRLGVSTHDLDIMDRHNGWGYDPNDDGDEYNDDDGGQADAAERLFLDGEGTLGGGRYPEPNE